ncbi:hypothetical protein HZC09_05400 [Candidatus Micrarchaeota archaeon]|nr:hypothetical protein [Candidatus Micrarchaeota archaeon]
MAEEFDRNPGVGMTMGLAEGNVPMLRATTRWNYLTNYLVLWKEMVRFRFYSYVLAILGVYFLFIQPLIAVPCLAAAMYFHKLMAFRKGRTLGSQRTVMIGH